MIPVYFCLIYFSHNYDNYSMFRDVPECSMFWVFIDGRFQLTSMRRLQTGTMHRCKEKQGAYKPGEFSQGEGNESRTKIKF